jgi:SAM-dependent methyltransferase
VAFAYCRTTVRFAASNPGVEAWGLLGMAIADYHAGRYQRHSAWLLQEDGECWPLAVGDFFRDPDDFPAAEATALDLCTGTVLDVGAGAGCHALVLQEREVDVRAVDVSPDAVAVMESRGVRRAMIGDFFDPALSGTYDTLLLLMNGIGLVGDLAGLERFFDRARDLLAEGGQVLFDSCDLQAIDSPRELDRIASRVRAGRYRGETFQQILYRDLRSAPLAWLYVDPETLGRYATLAGWHCQVVFEDDDGGYLARLVTM